MRIRIGYEAIRKRTTYPYRDNLSAKAGTARTRAVACGAGVNLSASAGRAYERPRPRARRKPPWMPLVAPSRRLPSQVSGSCPLAARLAARYRQGLTPILRYPHPSLLRCRGAVSRATLQGMTHHSFLVAPPRDLASHQQPHSPIRIMRSAPSSAWIRQTLTRGRSGRQSPTHGCMLSMSRTNNLPSSWDKAACAWRGYTAGLKTRPSPFFVPVVEAPPGFHPAPCARRRYRRHRSRVPRFHRCRGNAPLSMA